MSARAEYDPTDYAPRQHSDETTLAMLARDTSRKFHDLMDAAMLVSGFKYGAVSDAYPDKVSAMESLKKRLDAYKKTGNAEYLVDVANFAMIEFMHPAHAKAHYQATDAAGSPGRVCVNKDIYDRPNQFKNSDIEPGG